MMQKIEKFLDLLNAHLELSLEVERKKHGLPLNTPTPTPTPAVPPAVEAPVARKPRKTKAPEAPAPAAAPEDGMFPPAVAAETPAAKTNAEQFAEAAVKCQELVGAFIRRKNHSTPNTGLAAARAIVTEVAPACVGKKIEEWPHDARLKIIARLEQEMEAAGV